MKKQKSHGYTGYHRHHRRRQESTHDFKEQQLRCPRWLNGTRGRMIHIGPTLDFVKDWVHTPKGGRASLFLFTLTTRSFLDIANRLSPINTHNLRDSNTATRFRAILQAGDILREYEAWQQDKSILFEEADCGIVHY
jgi:hypothetical protein